MGRNIIDEIEREYRLIREYNQHRLQAVLDLARKNAEFKANEIELKTLSFEIAKAEQFECDQARAMTLKKNREGALKKRKAILKKLNLTEKDFILPYTCALCKDTGYISGKPCKCFNEKWKKLTFNSLGISPVPELDFSFDKAQKGPRTQKIYDAVKKYVNVFPTAKTRNFIFIGNTGCGKTYLASMMAGELSKKGFNCIFLTATELNQLFLKMHTAQYGERVDYMSALISCDFLVIDDLGTENIYKNVTVEYFLALISERLAKAKHTVITTNLNSEEIIDRYNERFFSRVTEKLSSATIIFDNVNFRSQKK